MKPLRPSASPAARFDACLDGVATGLWYSLFMLVITLVSLAPPGLP